MNRLSFSEKQYFREIAFFALLILMQMLFLWGFISQVILGKPWGTKPASDPELFSVNIFIFLILILLYFMNLKTEIDEESIRFQFFPFHLKKRVIPWQTVDKIRITEYNGIKDYWGWGLRYSPGKGWCYTISGKYGLKIILKNKKTLLIGTHNPNELSKVLESYKTKLSAG